MPRSDRCSTSKASGRGDPVACRVTARSSRRSIRQASTTRRERSPLTAIDLDDLGFDRGAHILVERALRGVEPGDRVDVSGRDPNLSVHLSAWARAEGHAVEGTTIVRGRAHVDRWGDAERAGSPDIGAVVDRPPASWGLAAR